MKTVCPKPSEMLREGACDKREKKIRQKKK